MCEEAKNSKNGSVTITRQQFEQRYGTGRLSQLVRQQLDRGCIGIAAIMYGCGVNEMPEKAPGTTCYRTESEAENHQCPAGTVKLIIEKQGRWTFVPDPNDTGPIPKDSMGGCSTYNYVSKIGGCYWYMNRGVEHLAPDKVQTITVSSEPPTIVGENNQDYEDHMWCVKCVPASSRNKGNGPCGK